MNLALNKAIAIVLISLPYSLLAQVNTSSPSCKPKKSAVEARYKINDSPQYFYKVTPDGKYLAYIGSEGNRLISLDPFNEDKLSVRLPGTIDPVFTPDGELLMVPMFKDQYNPGGARSEDVGDRQMSFYDWGQFKKLAEGRGKAKSRDKLAEKQFSSTKLRDKDLTGVYQTAGVMQKDSSGSKYKVITDHEGVTVREYQYSAQNRSVQAAGQAYKPCDKFKELQFDTPVLSKDGKYLSIRNQTSNTTQIYHLKSPGQCHLAMDLGVVTGKVSFSFDNKKLAFHIDEFAEPQGYFSGVKKTMTKNVYVMNVEESTSADGHAQLKPVSWARASDNIELGQGSYYPEFTQDGKIIYLSDRNNYFEFEKINPDKLNYSPYHRIAGNVNSEGQLCTDCEQAELNPLLGLATLWANVCAVNEKIKAKDAALMALSLTESSCRDLVNKEFHKNLSQAFSKRFNSKVRAETRELKAEDLLALCSKDPESAHSIDKGKWAEKKTITGMKDLLAKRCVSCHTQPIKTKADIVTTEFYNEKGEVVGKEKSSIDVSVPALDLSKIDTKTAFFMASAVNHEDPSKRMPRGGSLNPRELKIINDYISEIAADDPDNWDKLTPLSAFRYSPAAIEKTIEDSAANISDPEEKKRILMQIRPHYECLLGGKGCESYIKNMSEATKQKLMASGLSGDSLDSQLKQETQKLHCQLKYKVNREMCQD